MGTQYCQYSDLLNYIDAVNLAAMTNDYDGNQPVNMTVLNSVCAIASRKADALVSSIYQVPFNPVPVKIYTAAVIFSCELLYARRLTPEEKNPFKSEGDYWRHELMQINAGQLSLDEQFSRGFTPIVSVISKTRVDTNFF